MPPESAAAVYTGTVFHQRWAPRPHRLRYRVFYFLLDLDALSELDAASRWFGYNRRAWFSFRDADHGAGDGTPFRDWLARALAQAALGAGPWRFHVLCMPRVLGYVFNPITLVWCYAADGSLAAMVYEVNNTFGERLAYVIPVDAEREVLHQRCDKALFVSPFFPVSGHYEFRLRQPGPRLDILIDYHDNGAHQLRAAVSAERRPFSTASLTSLAWRQPLATLGVIAGIHFEALRLWLKGVPLIRHVVAPRHREFFQGSDS
ncbi:MAG: DUF1365 domain-containing protein [Gammaproteobacteria bacterium]